MTTVYQIFCICSAGDVALPLLEVNLIKFSKQPAMEKLTLCRDWLVSVYHYFSLNSRETFEIMRKL